MWARLKYVGVMDKAYVDTRNWEYGIHHKKVDDVTCNANPFKRRGSYEIV